MSPTWSDLQRCLGFEIPVEFSDAIDRLDNSGFVPELKSELQTDPEELLRVTLNWRRMRGCPRDALWIGTDLWCDTLSLLRSKEAGLAIETWRKVPYDSLDLSASEPFASWLTGRTNWLERVQESSAAASLEVLASQSTGLGGVVTPAWGFGIPGVRVSNKATHPGLCLGYGEDLVLLSDLQGGYRSQDHDSVLSLVVSWLQDHKNEIVWSPAWRALAKRHGLEPLDHEQLPLAARRLKAVALSSG